MKKHIKRFEFLFKDEAGLSIESDPFLVFGPTLHNFNRLNAHLVCIFLVLAILATCQMVIFRSFAGDSAFSNFETVANWSFGSIGFPTNLCSKAPLDWS